MYQFIETWKSGIKMYIHFWILTAHGGNKIFLGMIPIVMVKIDLLIHFNFLFGGMIDILILKV